MFRTGGTTGQAQLAVAAISGLDVDVAPFVGTTRERFAAVLGSCVRASSSKTRRPALPPETQRQADAAEPSHPRQRPRGDSQTGIGLRDDQGGDERWPYAPLTVRQSCAGRAFRLVPEATWPSWVPLPP